MGQMLWSADLILQLELVPRHVQLCNPLFYSYSLNQTLIITFISHVLENRR